MLGVVPDRRQKPGAREPAKRVILFALTLGCVAGAVVAVGLMLDARHDYEDALARAYAVEATNARLVAAGVAEEAALREPGRAAAADRRTAAAQFELEAGRALRLAATDPASERIVRSRVRAQRRARRSGRSRDALVGQGRLTLALLDARDATAELTARQRVRRAQAKDRSHDRTRAALVGGAIFAAFALIAAGWRGRARYSARR